MESSGFPRGEVVDESDLDDPDLVTVLADEITHLQSTSPGSPGVDSPATARPDVRFAWRAAGRAHTDGRCPLLRATHPDALPTPRPLSPADALELARAEAGVEIGERTCPCVIAPEEGTDEALSTRLATLREEGLLATLRLDIAANPTPLRWGRLARLALRARPAATSPGDVFEDTLPAHLEALLADATPLVRAGLPPGALARATLTGSALLLSAYLQGITASEVPEPYRTPLALCRRSLSLLARSSARPLPTLTLLAESFLTRVASGVELSEARAEVVTEALEDALRDTLTILPAPLAVLERTLLDLCTLAESTPPTLVVLDWAEVLASDPEAAALLALTGGVHHCTPRPLPKGAVLSTPVALMASLPALLTLPLSLGFLVARPGEDLRAGRPARVRTWVFGPVPDSAPGSTPASTSSLVSAGSLPRAPAPPDPIGLARLAPVVDLAWAFTCEDEVAVAASIGTKLSPPAEHLQTALAAFA